MKSITITSKCSPGDRVYLLDGDVITEATVMMIQIIEGEIAVCFYDRPYIPLDIANEMVFATYKEADAKRKEVAKINNPQKKIKIGDRCFFQGRHICSFGNIEKVNYDTREILVRGDDGLLYIGLVDDVFILTRKNEWI